MESRASDPLPWIAAPTLGAFLLAYGGGARLADVSVITGIGLVGGVCLAELLYPGEGPASRLIVKVDSCFRKAQKSLRELGEEADADLRGLFGNNFGLARTLELTTLLSLSFWVLYSLVEVELEDSLIWSAVSGLTWGAGHYYLWPDPPPPTYTLGSLPVDKPPVKKRPLLAPRVPLTEDEEKLLPTYLQLCKDNRQLIKTSLKGIHNKGNDCFMSAALQWLRNTPLLDTMLDTDPDPEKVEAHRFRFRLLRTLLQIGRINGLSEDQALSKWARSSLRFPLITQEDASEALLRMGPFFKFDTKVPRWDFDKERHFDLGKKTELPHLQGVGESDAPSKVDKCGFRTDLGDKDWLQQFLPPKDEKPISLQKLIDLQWEPFLANPEVKPWFKLEDKYYEAPLTCERKVLKTRQPDLYCTFNRFYKDARGGLHKRNYRVVTPDLRMKIEETLYEVKSFTVHSSSSKDGGHYYTYAQQNGTWTCFNDKDAEPKALSDAIKEFEQAYVVHFAQLREYP
ncbi:MAG: hypothetical protein AB7F31_03070 [Parachlamydiales bacterium]